eukprot:6197040-Pleurochrysis_carterae.AAC.1
MARTVKGMMKYRRALSIHLDAELPNLIQVERDIVLGLKFRCVAALQVPAIHVSSFVAFSTGWLASALSHAPNVLRLGAVGRPRLR